MNPTVSPAPQPPAARSRGARRRAALRRAALLGAVVVVLVVAGSAAAYAAAPILPAPPPPDLNTVLNNVRNWIMGIVGLVATVFLTVGGLRYMIANSDPGEINKAKDALRNAGRGYAGVVLAPVVVEILKSIFGG